MIIFSLSIVARIVPNPALVPGYLYIFVAGRLLGGRTKENPPAYFACGSLGGLGALFREYRPQHLKEGEKMFLSHHSYRQDSCQMQGWRRTIFQYFCWAARVSPH